MGKLHALFNFQFNNLHPSLQLFLLALQLIQPLLLLFLLVLHLLLKLLLSVYFDIAVAAPLLITLATGSTKGLGDGAISPSTNCFCIGEYYVLSCGWLYLTI